jgi:hypothetical protein
LLTQERNEARRNAIDEALGPVLSLDGWGAADDRLPPATFRPGQPVSTQRQ